MRPPVLKIAFAAFLTWIGLTLILIFVPPTNLIIQLVVLLITFLALSSTLTLLYYRALHKFNEKHLNRNQMFEDAMRRALIFSLAIVILALLKLAKALTPSNAFLLISALVALEYYFVKSKTC